MKYKYPAVFILLLVIALTATAQQKRQTTPKPQPKAVVVQAPAPTFDTLVPADSYILYGEVRGVGQLIRSSAVNDLLEPVFKLAGPPKEFRALVRWLNAHAEEVMTSRLLLATWPSNNAKGLPDALVAIEFASAEEATKFSVSLNEFLPKVLSPSQPEILPSPDKSLNILPEKKEPPAPRFDLKRFGSLVVLSPKPWTIKQLKPAGSKLLAEDTNFRAAHNRFSSELVFVYFDTKVIERQEEESRKQSEQQRIEAEKQAQAEAESKKGEEEKKEGEAAADNFTITEQVVNPTAVLGEAKDEPSAPDPVSLALSGLGSMFFSSGETQWPDGIAFALSFEGDSFDLRALLVNQNGGKADAIPFMPTLITGPPITSEAANILPADTELMLTMSLDLPQIYTTMTKPRPKEQIINSKGNNVDVKEVEFESPFAEIEKRLKMNIKDDLLPLVGPEIAIRLPMSNMNIIGLPGVAPPTAEVKEGQAKNGPVLAIAVKDKEALRALMPKIIEGFGFKGASSLAQTERREDTEIVSYANMFSYAFVGNFLVLSGEPVTTRYIVDSYLKHETLSADGQFRNSTRWQPKPQQGQLYISPALMEGYKTWAESPSTRISDQTRAFLVRASSMAQPITYSLSNEGLGPLHELHIPKNLVLMAVAGISGETNPSPMVQNERTAIGAMYMIAQAEMTYKKTKGNGSCATLDQLTAANMFPKEMIEKTGYKFELTVSGDKFELSAVPSEYGKSGNMSLFIDQTFILRGGDRNGAAATASDPPIN
ncbi:MAG TPA: DUF3352 domain-containing protein [Pyrinomonadaceae bacterium]|nr:DUF3352 domain-containing protein [Pyrinomonadaceae bacterium]